MSFRFRAFAVPFCAPLLSMVLVMPAAADSSSSGTALVGSSAALVSASDAGAELSTVTLKGVKVDGTALVPYMVEGTNTATRTDTPLIDIPQTIQAMPKDLLRDQNAQSLGDTMRNAPGVSVHQGEGNRDEIVIRGVKTKADFFVDGVRDDTEYYRDLYNVSEVDVLQGATAMMFGRAGAGGVVNLVTKQAVRSPTHELTLQAGSWQHRRAALDLGGALADAVAYRLNIMGEDSGGFRDYAFLHRYAINPVFNFRLGDRTTLDVGLERAYDNRRADRGIPSRGNRPVDVTPETFFGSPQQNFARTTVDSFHAKLQHDINENLVLRDTFRATRLDKFYQNTYPGSAVAPDDTLSIKAYSHGEQRNGFFNQAELVQQLDTGAMRHTLLYGVETDVQLDDDVKFTGSIAKGVALTDPRVPIVINKPDRNNHAVAHAIGAYVQDQVDLSPHWKALAGIRWDRFSVGARYNLLPAGTGTQHTDTAWSPRVGVIYKPTDNASLYASVTRSFTPQGSNLALSLKSPVGANLAPEKAVNYEIGGKFNLLDQKLALTAAVFQLDLDHVNTPDPFDPTQLVQTGAQRNRGFELGLNGSLTSRWSIYAGYAHLNAEIRSTTEDARAGAKVGLVPKNQASLWSRYAFTDHWGIGGGWVSQSRVYTSFDNVVVLPGYTRFDAMAYYKQGKYRVSLNVDNLFNVGYYATANGDNQIMPGAPRSVDLTLVIDL
ncbi:MAG: TonB-dependent siderophore receptor [Rhodanobacter sp.]